MNKGNTLNTDRKTDGSGVVFSIKEIIPSHYPLEYVNDLKERSRIRMGREIYKALWENYPGASVTLEEFSDIHTSREVGEVEEFFIYATIKAKLREVK